MNSSLMNDPAIAMALRIEKEFEDIRLRVKRAVQLAYEGFLEGMGPIAEISRENDRLSRRQKTEPVEYPTSITRSLVEENTGETLSMKRFFRSSKTINTTKG